METGKLDLFDGVRSGVSDRVDENVKTNEIDDAVEVNKVDKTFA